MIYENSTLFPAKPLQELVLVMIFIHPNHRRDDPNQLDRKKRLAHGKILITSPEILAPAGIFLNIIRKLENAFD